MKQKNLWKILCTLMFSVLLCIYAEYTICNGFTLQENAYAHAYIDVQEADGRYVTWREKDTYTLQNSLCFSCREGSFEKVLVSHDEGRSFLDETDQYLNESGVLKQLTIDPCIASDGPVCLRFVTKKKEEHFLSRDYKIQLHSNTEIKF